MEIAMRAAKNASAPAAEPQPYTIAKQDKSRWWEVLTPRASWCA